MSRIEPIAREYWFELMSGLLVISGITELAIQHGWPGAPPSSLWFTVPALIVVVLPLFARRWFPFAGPAGYWILAAAITFHDGVLIAYVSSLEVVGFASALALGYLRDRRQALAGLGVVV